MNRTQSTAWLLSFAVMSALQAQDATPKGEPGRGEPRPKAPLAAAWYDARAVANLNKAPILAFVVPEQGVAAQKTAISATRAAEQKAHMLVTKGGSGAPPMRTSREVLLRQVQLLRGAQRGTLGHLPKATDEQLVFALTVPVFATAKSCGAKPDENVVLLSPHGKRIKGWQLDLLQGEAFVKAIGEHVFAEEALAPRQANMLPKPMKLLGELRAKIAAKGEGGLAPYYAQQMHEKLAAELVALGPALVRREAGKLVAEPELWGIEVGRTPFGVTAHMDLGDPCPGCGMGYTPPGLLTVLKLVGP